MARVKIDIPEKSIFQCSIPVRISDINYGQHLGNDALVSLLHEARVQWLHSLQYTELSIETVGLIMADLAVMYKSESFYGDLLQIHLYVGETSSVSFELIYEIKNQHQQLVAVAKTSMVCFDYSLRKVTSLPAIFAAKLNAG